VPLEKDLTRMPAQLLCGFVDGGKKRGHLFLKQLPALKAKKTDPHSTMKREITITLNEKNVRLRRTREGRVPVQKGLLNLTQGFFMAYDSKFTKVPANKRYPGLGGTINANTLGPIALEHRALLAHTTKQQKKILLGNRLVAVGGACPEEGEGDPESGEEDDEADASSGGLAKPLDTFDDLVIDADAEAQVEDKIEIIDVEDDSVNENIDLAPIPLLYNQLPRSVLINVCKAWNVRHVVDFTPIPHVAADLVEIGISYVGVTGSEEYATYLSNECEKDLAAKIQDPNSKLADRRFLQIPPDQEKAGGVPPPSKKAGGAPPPSKTAEGGPPPSKKGAGPPPPKKAEGGPPPTKKGAGPPPPKKAEGGPPPLKKAKAVPALGAPPPGVLVQSTTSPDLAAILAKAKAALSAKAAPPVD
jgi:hypothetical protein